MYRYLSQKMAAKKLSNAYVTLVGDKEVATKPSSVLMERLAAQKESGQDEVDIILNGKHKHLFNNRVTDTFVKCLSDAVLDSGIAIGILDLGCNMITDQGAETIANLLRTGAVPVRELRLNANSIGAQGCKSICEALSSENGAKVEVLSFNGNPIGDEGGMAVSRILVDPACKVRDLDVGNSEIGTQAVIAIAQTMWYNTSVLRLNMENPRLYDLQETTSFHIAKMIRTNRVMQELYIGKHKIRDQGAQTIAQYLEDNASLRVLDLRANEISIAGAEAFAILLMKGGCILSSLNLSRNRIQDQGAQALGVALRSCRTLVDLDIRNNKIGDTGLVAIADAMASNSAIQRLQIFGNNFDDESADAFRELISTRFEYFQVECDVKPYVVDGKPLVAKNNLEVDMVVVDK